MIRIAIVEDEPDCAALLVNYIRRFEKEKGCECTATVFDNAIKFLGDYRAVYDIVYMDIEMPMMSGMTAAKKLRELDESVCLIFVTNMMQYALKGYEVDAMDFMVKPVGYFNFALKLRKAVAYVEKQKNNFILVEVDDAVKKIRINDIRYVEVRNHSLIYHLDREECVVPGQLKNIEEQLLGENFAKCNHCYLVNLNYVTEIRPASVVVGGEEIPMSRRKRREFLQQMADFSWGGSLKCLLSRMHFCSFISSSQHSYL